MKVNEAMIANSIFLYGVNKVMKQAYPEDKESIDLTTEAFDKMITLDWLDLQYNKDRGYLEGAKVDESISKFFKSWINNKQPIYISTAEEWTNPDPSPWEAWIYSDSDIEWANSNESILPD